MWEPVVPLKAGICSWSPTKRTKLGAGAFGANINLSTNETRSDPYLELNNSAGSFRSWKNTLAAGTGLKNGFSADLRLSRPVAKKEMTDFLLHQAPAEIGGLQVAEVSSRDGVKYILADDSWLLIRPSGTEPVLRVYAEGRSQPLVKELLGYGQKVAESVV